MSEPDNEKTRLIRRSSRPSPDGPPPPPVGHSAGPASGGYDDLERTQYVEPGRGGPQQGGDDDLTRVIDRKDRQSPAPGPAPYQPDEKTVLVRPSSSSSPAAAEAGGSQGDDFGPDGPVVGWLVVVKGPGRGKSLPLGYGMNAIGRDLGSNRVCLPFGDEQISHKKHAVLSYDPRGRKFYLQHGDSNNLTYLGEEPVLAPTILEGGEFIRIGDSTELRFVPLCGSDFDWESSE